MGYDVDLESISIDKYKEILKSADLLPSRMILKNNVDDIFNAIKLQGIENVAELHKVLKKKNKLHDNWAEDSFREGAEGDRQTCLY